MLINKTILSCLLLLTSLSYNSFAQQDTMMYKGGLAAGYENVLVKNFTATTLNHYGVYYGGNNLGYASVMQEQFQPNMLTHFMAYTTSEKGDGYAGHLVVSHQPLAIDLLDFKAIPVNNEYSLVTWTLAQEHSIVKYELERSYNGYDFANLYTKVLNSPSNTTITHEYKDLNPISGVNYYRIATVERDGKRSLSNIVLVQFKKGAFAVTLYPNPAQDYLNVQSHIEQGASIAMVDVRGVVVYINKLVAGQQLHTIPLQQLSAGTYALNIVAINGDKQTFKIIKN
jgi:hypothetical protein